ncbi:DUF6415 family natural product biosynthesis protein [Streptomyces sp. NPDC059003]|uniref:DUF6415 family natural product biosynthesis protein n=1 Tax=Streptomyces sp. NPDC059003 TaxID=3346691 RepID=UPI0036A673A7
MSPATAPTPTWDDIVRDVRLALALAAGRPTGEAADALRARLRGHIRLFAPAADRYAHALPPGHQRDIATATVQDARAALAPLPKGGDPAGHLRLLAKATDYTARYAASAPPEHGGT